MKVTRFARSLGYAAAGCFILIGLESQLVQAQNRQAAPVPSIIMGRQTTRS